ncbi:hypothetical protein Y032_0004g1948 [Ancylostoma ceylanicum]|uniref:Uncharacterized protein n=1 Tax=Ancylostoma ceylanicum TaxID=53326 RepID=A0A016VWH8_9BILA|nr:hypothetical protein Y032_0004g1948 [Ancylostoma ceylanicum]
MGSGAEKTCRFDCCRDVEGIRFFCNDVLEILKKTEKYPNFKAKCDLNMDEPLSLSRHTVFKARVIWIYSLRKNSCCPCIVSE